MYLMGKIVMGIGLNLHLVYAVLGYDKCFMCSLVKSKLFILMTLLYIRDINEEHNIFSPFDGPKRQHTVQLKGPVEKGHN